MDGKFRTPRSGPHNDKAHPPIHPVSWVNPSQLNENEKKVYEFVTRRFLACCSDDAKGKGTEIEILYGEEIFHANGLIVLEKNYLDVYVYDKWESSQQLPNFEKNEMFEPTEANISEGKTTAPSYLTEPELIGLMDANGIGTDATMAEHIAKIKEREYVVVNKRGSGRSSIEELIPTRLGIALVEGYDNVVAGLPNSISLSKPFLRKEMELRMLEICAGSKTRQEVVQQSLDMYREVFIHTQRRIAMLKTACRKYLVDQA
jgi:DNA topoisomerase-3